MSQDAGVASDAAYMFGRDVGAGKSWAEVSVRLENAAGGSDDAEARQAVSCDPDVERSSAPGHLREIVDGCRLGLQHARDPGAVTVLGVRMSTPGPRRGFLAAAAAGAVAAALDDAATCVPFLRAGLVHIPSPDGSVRVYERLAPRSADGSGTPLPECLSIDLPVLAGCFPSGVDDAAYVVLLAALYPHYSDRQLARLMEVFAGRDYYGILNDLALVATEEAQNDPATATVRVRLRESGWCGDDD